MLDLLFFHKRTRMVARTFLDAMKEKGGVFSPRDMGQFVKQLEAGKRGPKFTKRNFYPGILRRLVDMGLIAKTTLYDDNLRKVVEVYKIQAQPTTGHRPTRPSFLWLAYVASERWNEEFLDQFSSTSTEHIESTTESNRT